MRSNRPIFFNAALAKAMDNAKRKWGPKRWGIQIGSGKDGTITNLRFADDVVLVGTSLFQVRRILNDLIMEARTVG